MLRTAVVLLAFAAVFVGGLWVFQRQLIYFPGGSLGAHTTDLPGAKNVVLSTEDGLRLAATFQAPAERDDVVVLVANGNGGERSGRAPLARALTKRGLGVLLFDYRGYGGNPGDPSERGLGLDVRAARTFLVDEAGVAPERLLYFGESIGAAVVTGLAAEHPPGGLVLRSPFVDLASVGRLHYPFLPVGLLLKDRYPLAQQLRKVVAPVTVVFGSADSLIPPAQSREVAASAPNLRRLVEVEGANHNDLELVQGELLIDAVVDMADVVRVSSS